MPTSQAPTDQEKNGKQSFLKEWETLLSNYVNDKLLLLKLDTASKLAETGSVLIVSFLGILIGFIVFFFISIALAFYLSAVFKSQTYGFGLMALLYLFLLIIYVCVAKKKIAPLIADTIIQILFRAQKNKIN